jgi:metal-sulfur cluster biosynthetic enzyme
MNIKAAVVQKDFLPVIIFLLIFLVPSGVFAQSSDKTQDSASQAKENLIREELNNIKDPETGGPLPSFVPIDRITVEGAKATIVVRIPSYCPLKAKIIQLIKDRISVIEGVHEVEVVSLPKKNVCPVKKKIKIAPAVDRSKPKPRLPKFSLASAQPPKVYPGDTMNVSVNVKDSDGVVSVSANMGDVETIPLILKKGTKHNGTWVGVWKVRGTVQKNYVTTFKATNSEGLEAFTHVGWSDAVVWWDNAYAFRRQLTVVNNTASTLTTGYTVWATIGAPHMQADGDDLRIVYWNGATHTELDRHPRYLISDATEVYFKTQADISGNSADSNYYIYYGNPAASNPPANGANVYEYWHAFDNLTGWSTLSGSPSVAGGIVTLSPGTQINHNMGFLGNVYNKVFEQSVKANFSSVQAVWWGEQLSPSSGGYYCGYQCCDGTEDGWKDLMLVTSVINTARQTSLTGISNPGTGDETRSSSWAPTTTYNVYSQKWKANEVKHYHNRTLWSTQAVDVTTATFNVFMQLWNWHESTTWLTADWVCARPYVDPEPSVTLGAQEGPETRVGGATIRNAVIR